MILLIKLAYANVRFLPVPGTHVYWDSTSLASQPVFQGQNYMRKKLKERREEKPSTVEPPNEVHFEDTASVLISEVVPFSEDAMVKGVSFVGRSSLSRRVLYWRSHCSQTSQFLCRSAKILVEAIIAVT